MPSKARTRIQRRKWADSGCSLPLAYQEQVPALAKLQVLLDNRCLPVTRLRLLGLTAHLLQTAALLATCIAGPLEQAVRLLAQLTLADSTYEEQQILKVGACWV